MKFLSLLSILSCLTVGLVANPIAVPDTHGLSESIGQYSLKARNPVPAPVLPPSAKPGIHVWRRLDTRPTTYVKQGVNFDGLNKLCRDLGGQHVDVVLGDGHNSFTEIGLALDKGWHNKNNGDGAGVSAYEDTYKPIAGEQFQYVGRLDGRSTINSVKAKGMYKILTGIEVSLN